MSHTLLLSAGRRGPEGPRGSHSGMTGSLLGRLSLNSVEEGAVVTALELRPSAFTEERISVGRAMESSEEEAPFPISGGFHSQRLRKETRGKSKDSFSTAPPCTWV